MPTYQFEAMDATGQEIKDVIEAPSEAEAQATIRQIENSGGRATEEMIADKLGVSVENYRENLATLLHVETESIDGDGAMVLVDKQETPVELAARSEMLRRVREALDRLEKRDVTLLGLHYIEEMTFQEIADLTGESLNTAASRYRYATEKLRATLSEKIR